MLVERTIATRRLAPTAIAIVVAVFCVTLAPQGLMAAAPYWSGPGGGPDHRHPAGPRRRHRPPGHVGIGRLGVLRRGLPRPDPGHRRRVGTDQIRCRSHHLVVSGLPGYYFLTVEEHVESSPTRRFAVLVMLLCLFAILTMLLRKGQLPGLACGPVWRLVGSTALGLLLLTFTPTKWAVQFGAFAALTAALGAVTAFCLATVGLHSRRNLALYVTALLFVVAWATSGINGWFYVGNYGVPWYDRQPVLLHQPVTTMFLALAIITGLLAGWLHFRIDYAGHTEVKDTRRNRVPASTPLLAFSLIMVLLSVGSMAKAFAQRYPAYTNGKAGLEALRSDRRKTAARWPMTSWSRPTQCRDAATGAGPDLGTLRPPGGEKPIGSPQRNQRHPLNRSRRSSPTRARSTPTVRRTSPT